MKITALKEVKISLRSTNTPRETRKPRQNVYTGVLIRDVSVGVCLWLGTTDEGEQIFRTSRVVAVTAGNLPETWLVRTLNSEYLVEATVKGS